MKRLVYINNTMDSIHDRVNEIYEGLVDMEPDEVKTAIAELTVILEEITNSI